MRFALVGDHPDGIALAQALGDGGHTLAAYAGPVAGGDSLRAKGLSFTAMADAEEVLADPAVEVVIVASRSDHRANDLRRALQSERHVLCVHPADGTADIAHEAAMLQGDTKCVLLPIMPEALHPAVIRLKEGMSGGRLGELRLVDWQRWTADALLIETDSAGRRPAIPGWNLLRAVGGELAEVSAFAMREEVYAEHALLVSGRFSEGGLLQASLLPSQSPPCWRLFVLGTQGSAELIFPDGWEGQAVLTWTVGAAAPIKEEFPAWNPWPAFLQVFAEALKPGKHPVLSWQDEIRALELDAAVRRSVEYRRGVTLEYQEASEEVGFKGTMTLVGCALLWTVLLFTCLSAWVPWLGWLIAPVLVLFLGLQLFRWIIPSREEEKAASSKPDENGTKPVNTP